MEEGRRWSEGGIREFLWKNRGERWEEKKGERRKFYERTERKGENFGGFTHADLYSEERRLLSIFLVRGLGG